MCGIVGYVGKKQAENYLLAGLETLEYRGYDSAGIAVSDGETIRTSRSIGRVENLKTIVSNKPVLGGLGIGHTRWATHGGVLNKNTHPHCDKDKQFYVVHNGIIENHDEIRAFLKKHGYSFYSDTDTEVIPNLISYHYKKSKSITSAFRATLQTLRGAYALAMITSHDPDNLYIAKLSSPLAIGVSDDAIIVGSDSLPIIGETQDIVYLEDNEMAILNKDGYKILDILTKKSIKRDTEVIEADNSISSMGNFPDFMSKEISEAPDTVKAAIRGRLKVKEGIIKLGGLELVEEQLRYIDRIIIIACGTSYYAGMVGEYLIEEIAGIPVEVQQASEFRYKNEPLSRSTAVLVISQSGETADSIAALKKLEGTGILKLGIVNAPGSTISRMTDAGVYCHAGPEKAVASTKAFIAQVTILILIALYMSKNYANYTQLMKALYGLPGQIETLLATKSSIRKIAQKYAHHNDFLYIGRRYGFPVALEGALKLKEVSYIHAEGFAGGEMKHGPLALIDRNFPTFAIALTNDLDEKSLSNMQEIHARKGPIIAVVDDKDSPSAKLADETIIIPRAVEPIQPILSAVATHLFAYYAATELNRDIDKPRNLAKSVTVE